MSGILTLLLNDPTGARPYATILDRLTNLPDPEARLAAREEVCRWLAHDLAVFAAERPNAPTIVISNDLHEEWVALRAHARLVIAEQPVVIG